MNNRLIFAIVVGTIGASASAFEYRSDSGVSDTGLGLTAGGNVAWMETFVVSGGNNNIGSISLAFGTPAFAGTSGVTAGQTFKVYVWKGTPTGAGVDTPTLLATATSTVNAASIETDVFQTVNINALVTGTSNFFIGASINHAAGKFPSSLQTVAATGWPILNNSWIAGSGTTDGFDPNNLAGGIGILQNSQVGFAGNWLIRAQTAPVPEPVSMIAIGMGLSAMALRRRKKA